jgi:periplasmic protein TonB
MGKLLVMWFFLLVLIFQTTFAQSSEEPLFINTTLQPEFPGGTKALVAYLRDNVRYPKEAAKAKVTGRVFGSFVIDTVGCISQVSILKGIGYGCDEEVMRVIEKMPRWIPGRESGRLVRVKYNLPVSFPPNY